MTRSILSAAIGLSLAAACTTAGSSRPELTPALQARSDSGRPPFTAADLRFMNGMIGHHAQAVVMAGWAPSHGARPDVQRLAERIVVAQRDEIAMMQRWLRERHERVPDAGMAMEHAAMHDSAGMPGMSDDNMLMPGMLTMKELARLDRARGPEFDRLFLSYMIRHHEGALAMVGELLGSPGAAQDTDVYRFATDVNVDQVTEIDRMRLMLRIASGAPTR